MVHAARIGQSFASWLYRPYFDLGPVCSDAVPHHVAALDVAYRGMVDDRDHPYLWALPSPSFREAIVHDTGLHDYDVRSPAHLPAELRWTGFGAGVRP